MLLAIVLAFLCLSYLFLTIGELANANMALLVIGGWVGVICALVSWDAALAGIFEATPSPFQLPMGGRGGARSEEHTSEIQSPDHLVLRLLLFKKKKDRI